MGFAAAWDEERCASNGGHGGSVASAEKFADGGDEQLGDEFMTEIAWVHAVGKHIGDGGFLFRGEVSVGGVDIDERYIEVLGEGSNGIVIREQGGRFETVFAIGLVRRFTVEFPSLGVQRRGLVVMRIIWLRPYAPR